MPANQPQIPVPLTRLSDGGRIETFDVTTAGKGILFDRIRQRSDIVLRPAEAKHS